MTVKTFFVLCALWIAALTTSFLLVRSYSSFAIVVLLVACALFLVFRTFYAPREPKVPEDSEPGLPGTRSDQYYEDELGDKEIDKR
jgi:hypothetical protein